MKVNSIIYYDIVRSKDWTLQTFRFRLKTVSLSFTFNVVITLDEENACCNNNILSIYIYC